MPLGSEEMIDENELNLIDSEEASGLSWARVEVRVTTQVIEKCIKMAELFDNGFEVRKLKGGPTKRPAN